MNSLFNALFDYIKPIIVFALSGYGIMRIIMGAIVNPEGAVNTFLIKFIDLVSLVFPSTPDSLKIGTLISTLGEAIPMIGKSVIYEVFQTVGIILVLSLAVKIYKLIPFKAT